MVGHGGESHQTSWENTKQMKLQLQTLLNKRQTCKNQAAAVGSFSQRVGTYTENVSIGVLTVSVGGGEQPLG